MKFTKMHGLGNDYLYVYGDVPENIAELSQKLSERHFGAGSDGMPVHPLWLRLSQSFSIMMRRFLSCLTEERSKFKLHPITPCK